MNKKAPKPPASTNASNRSPASRRRRDRDAREHEILQSAFEEFAAHGYAATRLEDVARRAGVAKGLPNFYFANKAELFKAVVRRLVLPDWSALESQLEGSESSTAELRSLIAVAYERLVGNPRARELLRLLIAEGPRFPELTEFYYAEIVDHALGLLGKLLDRGIERGEIRPGPVLQYPQAIIGPALLAVVWELLFAERRPLDLARYFEAHLDLVTHGLTPH
jgi:AcrR family transcriptional regulator